MTSFEEGLADGSDTGTTQKKDAAEMRQGEEETRQGEETLGLLSAGQDGGESLMKMTSQRMEKSALACVLPSDYTDRKVLISAQHYQDLEMQTDFVELKSFVEEAKANFFKDNPMDDESTPMKIKEARYMYENYYPCAVLTTYRKVWNGVRLHTAWRVGASCPSLPQGLSRMKRNERLL
jgi:hypothetical protein